VFALFCHPTYDTATTEDNGKKPVDYLWTILFDQKIRAVLGLNRIFIEGWRQNPGCEECLTSIVAIPKA
jgi:hypothetical protein